MFGFNNQEMRSQLAKMDKIVPMKVFTSLDESGNYRQCPACEETVKLIEKLEDITDKIEHEEVSLFSTEGRHVRLRERFGVSRAPTILLPSGIRYTGSPMGMETAPFAYTLVMISTGKTIFGDLLKARAATIPDGKLTLIVTPTCPYCSQAVLIENSIAVDTGGRVKVEIVESYENPDIARKWDVTGVPVTIVNDKVKITGTPRLDQILAALG